MPLLRLASASPRRRLIFRLAGIPVTVEPSRAREATRAPGPVDLCATNARAKALDSAGRAAGAAPTWTLGADTIVVLDGEVLGKPPDEDACRSTLSRLSGRTHDVLTGWCLCSNNEVVRADVSTTRVTFRHLATDRIEDYIESREWTDKAGGYAIQGLGSWFITRIDGDPFNVMGLPISPVVSALLDLGVLGRYPLDTSSS